MDSKDNLFTNPWVAIGLPAITILLGTQMLRALFPLLLYVLGDRFGYTAVVIGGLALVLFCLSLLANILRQLLSARVFLIITVLGVGLCRLALQLWPNNAVAYLILCGLGSLSFAMFFPVYLAAIRPHGREEVGTFGLGIQVGVILAILFNGLYNTYELNWQPSLLNSALVVVVVFLQAGCLAGALFKLPTPVNDQDTPSFKQALAWATIGPGLFLQLLLFANIATISATTGLNFPQAFVLAAAGGVAGFLGAGAVFWRGTNRLEVIGGGIVLLIVIAVLSITHDYQWILVIVGPLMLGEWLMVVLMNLELGHGRKSARNLTLSNSLGWILFVVFIFLYYAGYQLPLPFPNSLITNLAFLLTFLAGLLAIFNFPQGTIANKFPVTYSLGAAGLILLALVGFKYITWTEAEAVPVEDKPLRVMTYNLHNGVNPQGQLDLEAIAQTIEAENPDVVALQEVSRGWVVNGSVDMLQWLSQRLNMPYVWGPTEGQTWGNATFSRYPFTETSQQALPPETLLLHRGFTAVEIDLPDMGPVQIINTHFHHITTDSDIRVQQSQAILDAWQASPHTILMGDLNAAPDAPEMERLQDAGLVEGVSAAGISPGYTYLSTEPTIQLDYIWYTADLSAADLSILPSQASDHLGITAVISGE